MCSEPARQRRGAVPIQLEDRCDDTGGAGLGTRMSVPVESICDCLSDILWKGLSEDWLARVEDDFSRDAALLSVALIPELWQRARACFR